MSRDNTLPAAPATTAMIDLPKRHPGRPKKYSDCAPDPQRRPRGRPRKDAGNGTDANASTSASNSTSANISKSTSSSADSSTSFSSALSSVPSDLSASNISMNPSTSASASTSSSLPQRRRRAISESTEDEADGPGAKQRPSKRSGANASVASSSSLSSSSLAISIPAGPKASTPPLSAPATLSAPLKRVALPTLPGSSIPHQRPWDSWPANLRNAFRGVLDTKEQGVQLAKAICDHQGGKGVWSLKTPNHYQRVTCESKKHCQWCIEVRWEQNPDGFGNEFFVWRCVLLNNTHDHREEKEVAAKAPPKIPAKAPHKIPAKAAIVDDDDDDDLSSVMTEEEEEGGDSNDESSESDDDNPDADPDADSGESTSSLSSDSEDEDYKESDYDFQVRTGRRPSSGRKRGRPRKADSVAKPSTSSTRKAASVASTKAQPAKKPGVAKPSRFNCRRDKSIKLPILNGGHTKRSAARPSKTTGASQAPAKTPLRYAGAARGDVEYKVVGAPEGSQQSSQSRYSQLTQGSATTSEEIRSMLRDRIDRLPPVPRRMNGKEHGQRDEASDESLSPAIAAAQDFETPNQSNQASGGPSSQRARGAEEGPPMRQMRPFLSAPPMESTTPGTGQGTPQSAFGEALQDKLATGSALAAHDTAGTLTNGHDAGAESDSGMRSLFSGSDDDSVEWVNASSDEREIGGGGSENIPCPVVPEKAIGEESLDAGAITAADESVDAVAATSAEVTS